MTSFSDGQLLEGQYDSLYVSAHPDDPVLSCAARLSSEQRRRARILVVSLFAGAQDASPAAVAARNALARVGGTLVGAGVPEARERNPYYGSFRARTYDRHVDDEGWAVRVAHLLAELADRIRPRAVYAPLAVGGHVDRRLAHEAALAALEGRDGRNVYLYEDKPDVVVPGAVRIRLGQLGARLPPAAGGVVEEVRLARFLGSIQLPSRYRGELRGVERFRSLVPAARSWFDTRPWRPGKGLGLRIQPIIHRPGDDELEVARELLQVIAPAGRSRAVARRLDRLAAAYERRLGGTLAERYWLVLPQRESDGRVAIERAPSADAGTDRETP